MFPPAHPTNPAWPSGPPGSHPGGSSALGDSSRSGSGGPRVPVRTVGPYQLLTQLGNTSQGPVFAARIPGNEASFALKVFQRQLPPEEVARVRQEIQAVSRLEHPGIVRPVDVGLEQGRLYVVYEHVPGPTLQEQLSKSGPLPSEQAARMVADLAEALHAAHEVGVLHRDLHPGCVVVDSRSGRARVGDFGHPHDLAAGGTQARPTYQAPEQLKAEPVDVRTDVYGLGAILYELLTCMPPFSGLSHEELRQRILAGRPDAPRDLVASVDPAVEKVCLKALALLPRKRPPTAEALGAALRRAADRRAGRPSLAAMALLGLCWALSLAVAGAWGWGERRGRLDTDGLLVQARASEEKLQGDVARLGSDVARGVDELRAERDGRRREGDRLRQEVAGLKQQLQQAAAAGGAASGRGSPLLPVRGDLARALDRLLQDLKDVAGADRVRLRLLMARMAYPQAMELVTALRGAAPEDEGLLVTAVRCALLSGDRERFQGLREELERRATPGGAAALYARLLAQEGQQTTAEAMQQLVTELREKAASSDAPYLNSAACNLLRAFAQQTQQPQLYQEALRCADKALELDPLDSDARHARFQLFFSMAQMMGNRAGEALRRALGDLDVLRELAARPGLWIDAAQVQLVSGNPDQAAAELEEAVRYADQTRNPVDQVRTRVWAGNLAAIGRDENRALARWQEAMDLIQRSGQNALWGHMAETVNGLLALGAPARNKFMQSLPPQLRDQITQILAQVQQQQQQQQRRR